MGRQWLVWLLAAGAILAQPVAGLVGRFGDGAASVVFVSRSPNFYLEPGESIHPSLGAVFSGQWEGSLQVLAAGAYEFNRPVDIDGVSGAKHTLTAGMHAILRERAVDLDIARLSDAARELFRGKPCTFAELRPLLTAAFPGLDELHAGVQLNPIQQRLRIA
jgi:hypothetical protein